jgi:hypothetical protein
MKGGGAPLLAEVPLSAGVMDSGSESGLFIFGIFFSLHFGHYSILIALSFGKRVREGRRPGFFVKALGGKLVRKSADGPTFF